MPDLYPVVVIGTGTVEIIDKWPATGRRGGEHVKFGCLKIMLTAEHKLDKSQQSAFLNNVKEAIGGIGRITDIIPMNDGKFNGRGEALIVCTLSFEESNEEDKIPGFLYATARDLMSAIKRSFAVSVTPTNSDNVVSISRRDNMPPKTIRRQPQHTMPHRR